MILNLQVHWKSDIVVKECVKLKKALFTVGQNMISLIMNETCFVMKSVHIKQCINCANHSWNIIILGMIEIALQGSFNHDSTRSKWQTDMERRWVPTQPKLGLFFMSSWNMGR